MNLSEYKDVIKFAMANEVEAQKFYADAAEKLRNPSLKKMFSQFAQEEKKHREILKQIYISNQVGEYFDKKSDYRVSETVDTPEHA